MDTEEVTPESSIPAEAPPPEESMAEHEQQFGRRRTRGVTATAPLAPPNEAEPQGESERDPATGKFKPRHRAAKDTASPDDVPRIKNLTAENKKLKEELEKARTITAAPVVTPPTEPPPATAPLAIEKPKRSDFSDEEKYLDARDAYNRQIWAAEERIRQDNLRIVNSWAGRVAKAMEAHDDYEAVALKAPTKIQAGSLMDAFILESDNGAEILYALQRDDGERQRIAALPPVQQAEALALLGHQLTAKRAPQTGTTGAVAAAPLTPPAPRPPTPVRTGPMRTGEEPPGDDASIADHEKAFGVKGRRR